MAIALIRPLAWEPPYAAGAAQKTETHLPTMDLANDGDDGRAIEADARGLRASTSEVKQARQERVQHNPVFVINSNTCM